MTKKKEILLEDLRRVKKELSHDIEQAHADADGLLLTYLNDKEIAEAYNAIPKWYA